jgi:hypothetical protein
MLATHPDVEWCGEVFHPLFAKPNELEWVKQPVDLLTHPLKNSKSKLFGFETKFQHLGPRGLNSDLDDFLKQLVELRFDKFILLKRRNYLRQAISVARGRSSGQWHYSSDQPQPDFSPVELEIDALTLTGRKREILESFEFMDQTYDIANSLMETRSSLTLEYEVDLEVIPQKGFRKVTDFLELSNHEPQVNVRKLGGKPIREMISNYSAVEKKLVGTRFEWMLD